MAYISASELQEQLEVLAQQLGVSVSALISTINTDIQTNSTAITANNTALASAVARLDAIDVINDQDGIETIAEKVVALNAIFTENGSLATDVLNRIAANSTDIAAETARAIAIEVGLRTDVDAVAATSAINATNISSISANLATETARASAAELANANAISDVELNVQGLSDDISNLETTVANNLSSAVSDSGVADQVLQDQINDLDSTISGVASDVSTVEGRASNIESDIVTLKGDDTTTGSIAKTVKDAVEAETTAREAADDSLQSQINTLSGTGTGSVGDLETRITADEDAMDTLNASSSTVGSVAKTVKDAVEAEAAKTATDLATETAARIAGDATNASNITANTDAIAAVVAETSTLKTGLSGLTSGTVNGRKAANFFRLAVGQTVTDETLGSTV